MAGVVAAFRKKALFDVNYWSPEMITDDIDVTWKLQKNGWHVLYQPAAVCWILMPETLKGLWQQRLRWAQGSGETALKHGLSLFSRRGRRMLPILLEYLISLIWAHAILMSIVLAIYGHFSVDNFQASVTNIVPSHWVVILGITFFLQSAVSMLLEKRYETPRLQQFFWMIWYPLAYWLIMATTAVLGLYKAIFTGRKKLATWVSPDRGIR